MTAATVAPIVRGIADPWDRVSRVMADVWERRDRPPMDLWCDEHRRLPATGASAARPGRWNTDAVPYFREPMRMALHPAVQELAVLKSSQVGYSEFINSICLMALCVLRQPVLMAYPTYDTGTAYNEKRLIPAIEHCDEAKSLIRSPRDLTKTEVTLGGVPVWFGYAQTIKSLKSNPVAIVCADELDEWPPDGVALQNCRDRQRTFSKRLLVKGSTPVHAQGIAREYEEAKHRYRFLVPCPLTGKFFEPWDLSLLRWEGGLDADPDRVRRNTWIQSPFVPVPRRLAADGDVGVGSGVGRIHERHKKWMVLNGVWVRQGEEVASDGSILETIATDPVLLGADYLSRIPGDELREAAVGGRRLLTEAEPDPRGVAARERLGVQIVGGDEGCAGRVPPAASVGFRINTLASLIDADGWGGVAARYVATRGKPGSEWYKGTLGQLPKGEGDSLSVRQVRALCRKVADGGYRLGSVPAPCAAVYGGIDVQRDGVYAVCCGFGPMGEPIGLVWAERIARSEPRRLEDVIPLVAQINLKVWDAASKSAAVDGRGLSVLEWGIDSGHFTSDVYRACSMLRAAGVRAHAVKGVGEQSRFITKWSQAEDVKDERGIRRRLAVPEPLLLVNGDRLKTQLYAMLMPDGDPEAGDRGGISAEDAMLFAPRRGETGVLLPDDGDGWDQFDDQRSRDALDFLTQVTNEHRVPRRVQGREVFVWQPKTEKAANHYLDAWVYCLAIARTRGVDALSVRVCEEARARGGRSHEATKARSHGGEDSASGKRQAASGAGQVGGVGGRVSGASAIRDRMSGFRG